jgi:hypothetical protein
MVSEDDERVSWHSDTLVADQAESPYVEGAAVLVVMKGMRQMLFTRGLKGGTTQKVYDFPSLGVPAVELTDGSAYVLPAGKAGSVDWLVEHCTHASPSGRTGHGVGRSTRETKAHGMDLPRDQALACAVVCELGATVSYAAAFACQEAVRERDPQCKRRMELSVIDV